MPRWDIEPGAVRGVLDRTGWVAGQFEEQMKAVNTALTSSLMADAITAVARAQTDNARFILTRTNACIDGDLEMAANAQAAANDAPAPPGQRLAMISAAAIPRIPGDMQVLAEHARQLQRLGSDIADTGSRCSPADFDYGRNGIVVDPFGHRWMVASSPAPTPPPRHGEVGYLTCAVPDAERVKDVLRDGAAEPRIQPLFHVDDLDTALAAVRAQGGQAGEPEQQPYGLSAECTDDQGAGFRLLQS